MHSLQRVRRTERLKRAEKIAQISARPKSSSQAVKIKQEQTDRELLFSIYNLCMKNKEEVELLKEKVSSILADNKKLQSSNSAVLKKEIFSDLEKEHSRIEKLISSSIDQITLQNKNFITEKLKKQPTFWEKVKMLFKNNYE